MQKTVEQLHYWLIKVPEVFRVMTEAEITQRPAPKKWSKKEVIGHLSDSAIVNLERFLQIQNEASPYVVTTYDQVQWVALQGYQELPIEDILMLWTSINKKIMYVLNHLDEETLAQPCVMNQQQRTLGWLIEEYMQHLAHHIHYQILMNECET